MIPSPIKVKRKCQHEIDYIQCFFCQKTNDEPLHGLTEHGLKTLKTVAADQISYEFLFDGTFLSNNPVYHKSCYAHFISAFKKIESSTNENQRNSQRTSKDFKTICFICQKDRDKKGARHLILVSTLQRQNTIHQKAKEISDTKILTLIQGFGDKCIDMIAADFRYHTSCMSKFMNIKPKRELVVDVYEKAFDMLLDDISSPLLNGDSVFYAKDLLSRYKIFLAKLNVEDHENYQTQKLLRRFKTKYGEKILIFTGRNSRSILCSSNLSVKSLINLTEELKTTILNDTIPDVEEKQEKCKTYNNELTSKDLFLLAKHLRAEILSFVSNQKLDLLSSLNENLENYVPPMLFNFIAWIITLNDQIPENEKIVLHHDVSRKIVSFCQDIIRATSNADMPKHVGIALHVMKICRSKNLILLLNKFGHSIGYTDCQRILASIANDERKNSCSYKDIPIPRNLKSDNFVQFAFDNLDFYDETRDGHTFHGTTHIFYQHGENHCSVPNLPAAKPRNIQIKDVVTFEPVNSTASIKHRREARKIYGLEFEQYGLEYFKITLDSKMLFFLLRNLPTKTLTMKLDTHLFFNHTWYSYFNIVSPSAVQSKTHITYGPIFPSPPVTTDVVQTSMEYFQAASESIGQEYTVITCDQAIYDIAQGIKSCSPKFENVILQFGGFHIAQNFLKTIAFFMKDSGFEEILVASGAFSQTFVGIVTKVSNYYKAVHCHFIFAQAIFGLIFESFEDFLGDVQESHHLNKLDESVNKFLIKISEDSTEKNFAFCTLLDDFTGEISPLWESYVAYLNPTAQFWYQYLSMVSTLFKYIHAVHSGNWELHLEEIQNMVPFMAAAGHHNYTKCLPKYLDEMRNLPPAVYDQFLRGNFGIHLTQGGENSIWTDMALEETYNKDGKTVLFKGATTKPELREKYIAALPTMAAASSYILQQAGMKKSENKHHGETKRTAKEEYEISEKIKNFIRSNCSNPFVIETSDLINVVTGVKATSNDIAYGWKFGCEILNLIMSTEEAKIPKMTPFKNQKIKEKKEALKEIYIDEIKMLKNLCFIENDIAEKELAFSHEWCAYPPSLFEPISNNVFIPRKGGIGKHEFLKVLEDDVGNLYKLPKFHQKSKVCVIVDAMAFIQKLKDLNSKNFLELSQKYANILINNLPEKCEVVHFVGDRYDFSKEASLKSNERNRRLSKISSSAIVTPLDSASIPSDWKTYIGNGTNKSNLMKYVTSKWSESPNIFPKKLTIYFGGTFEAKEKAKKIQGGVVEDAPKLFCTNHEEADTRIFAHLAHSVEVDGTAEVIIDGTDTDLVIYSLYHFDKIKKLTKLWIKRKESYLPIHEFLNVLKKKYRTEMIGSTILWAYVFSGCDNISYPFGKTKAKAAKILLKNISNFNQLAYFGEDNDFNEKKEYLEEARSYFVKLYDSNNIQCLNKLRLHLFASKNTTDLRRLPPTENAFLQHFRRCLFWIVVVKQARHAKMNLPLITNYGYKIDSEKGLQEILYENSRLPKLEKVRKCKCTTGCDKKCKCKSCNIACGCYVSNIQCKKGASTDVSTDEEEFSD